MKGTINHPHYMSIGIDIGGTFTDAVFVDGDGNTKLAKLPSSRADPSTAVNGVLEILARDWGVKPSDLDRFIQGTTVATKEVLERQGAYLGNRDTDGLPDALKIGQPNRKGLY